MMYENEEKKKRIVIPENRTAALEHLLNPPPPRGERRDSNRTEQECKILLLYLNMAVINIQEIAQIDVTDEAKIEEALKNKGSETIRSVGRFLWLFRQDEPDAVTLKSDGKEYKAADLTLMLVQKIFALRNLFAHSNRSDILPLLSNRDFYVLLEGILLEQAREYVAEVGGNAEKLFKLKLMNQHSFLAKTDILFEKNKQYELTRKGIIFLTCLGLYKDEAEEFCQQFKDMQLPERCPFGALEECGKAVCSQEKEKKCNFSKIKSLRQMFTYFACRKGRREINAANLDYMCFSDIITYLNKVPEQSLELLPLKAEKDMLELKKALSEEQEHNKEYKYSLHKRFKNRFLAFATAYCEDFELLPSLRFKRLDISDSVGRKRYCFGTDNDQRNRMDRHYAIKNDAVHFEFIPTAHYGEIHIDSLRSSIGETEFKNLFFCGKRLGFARVDAALNEYFSAYHRILEVMINALGNQNLATKIQKRNKK